MSDFPTVVGAEAGDDVRSAIHNPNLVSAIRAWHARLKSEALLVGEAAAQRCRSGTIDIRRSVPATLHPCCVDEDDAIVEIARTHALYPVSTGHNRGYGDADPVIDDCVAVDRSALDRIPGHGRGDQGRRRSQAVDPKEIIAPGRYAPTGRLGKPDFARHWRKSSQQAYGGMES